MSEHNISIEGGTSVRLPTAGKYCDRDIIVTATGGGTTEDLEDAFVARTLSGEYSNDRVTQIGIGAFAECANLTKISLPNVSNIRTYAFQTCSSLTEVDIPNATKIENYAFQSCSSLTEVDMPDVTSIGGYAFQKTKLSNIYFPLAKSIGTYTFGHITVPNTIHLPSLATASGSSIRDNSGVTRIELDIASKIDNLAFYSCGNLATLILRKSDAICTLSNVNAFSNSGISKGNGYIYVPSALVDTYKTATNWSTYAARFRAIEDYPEITGG